jgi:hypothetical protein
VAKNRYSKFCSTTLAARLEEAAEQGKGRMELRDEIDLARDSIQRSVALYDATMNAGDKVDAETRISVMKHLKASLDFVSRMVERAARVQALTGSFSSDHVQWMIAALLTKMGEEFKNEPETLVRIEKMIRECPMPDKDGPTMGVVISVGD